MRGDLSSSNLWGGKRRKAESSWIASNSGEGGKKEKMKGRCGRYSVCDSVRGGGGVGERKKEKKEVRISQWSLAEKEEKRGGGKGTPKQYLLNRRK